MTEPEDTLPAAGVTMTQIVQHNPASVDCLAPPRDVVEHIGEAQGIDIEKHSGTAKGVRIEPL